jgi:hypothetical protein
MLRGSRIGGKKLMTTSRNLASNTSMKPSSDFLKSSKEEATKHAEYVIDLAKQGLL